MRTGRKITLIIAFVGLVLLTSSCGRGSANPSHGASSNLTGEEKHRLYAAALASSDSPLDTKIFKLACQKIGIFDQDGQPNDKYMAFVTEHFEWGTSEESEEFRRQINTREKAKAYVEQHLP
jgi:hypothetical protein